MTWLAGFRSAIAGYKYYTDFEKIYKNVRALIANLFASFLKIRNMHHFNCRRMIS